MAVSKILTRKECPHGGTALYDEDGKLVSYSIGLFKKVGPFPHGLDDWLKNGIGE